jgi:hypothetical protein
MPLFEILWAPTLLVNLGIPILCLAVLLLVMRYLDKERRNLSRQIAFVVQYILLLPYITFVSYTWHPLLRNKHLTPAQARLWTMFNLVTILFGVPIGPLIYSWLEKRRSERVRVQGCLEGDHLSIEHKKLLEQYADESPKRRNVDGTKLF